MIDSLIDVRNPSRAPSEVHNSLFISVEKLVPGEPELFVEQPETAVVVSWTIKDTNGVLKEYHVTYTREDDLSETQTLATKKMEAQFDLKAGKTYEFQVNIIFNLV